MSPESAVLLRHMVRLYVRSQSLNAACMDGQSSVQCHILNELLRHGPLTQQQLSERLALDKAWVSRAVYTLTQQDLLTRQAHPSDKRSALLQLNEQGQARARHLDQQLNQHAETVINPLNPVSAAALPQALRELIGNLEQQLSACSENKKASCRNNLS